MVQKKGLENLVGERKIKDTLVNNTPYIETVLDSQAFFLNELEADPSIFSKYPLLVSCKVEENLRPKYEFYKNEIGMKKKKIAKNPRLFTTSLDIMKDRFQHYLKMFEGNEEQTKSFFRKADTILGYDTTTIDDKIKKYKESGVDFHQNYSLLEKRPQEVIDTKEYLKEELGILPPSKGNSWYYMLLAVSKDTIKPKIEYCNNEGIKWEKSPKVLILGLGTEENLGALPRRVELIKKEFKNQQLPSLFDYKQNPLVLTNPDKILKDRIRRYK
ncbi:MAG: hypothetical protein U9R34_06490 [Nanoarchaeota archaeon]|nr:hypothetical protein [Nanoarchaeota archaeon]